MSHSLLRRVSLVCLLAMCLGTAASLAHDHYAAGIVDSNGNGQADAGEPLAFVGTTGTAKLFHLCPRPFGFRPSQHCGGYYMLDESPRTLFPADSFSFIVLSDGQYDVAGTNHARTGSWIWMEIVSVTGPAGGQFGFWDANVSQYQDTPTVSFPVNQPTGNYQFVLSEGYDDIGEDPLGHIHGRAWTATKPGDYYVGFRLVDKSTSNNGGPWHTPSQVYIYHFEAGPNFKPTVQWGTGNRITMTWPSLMGIDPTAGQVGITFTIERATTLAPANWTTIGTVVGTTGATVSFTDNTPPVGGAFYRRKFTWSVAAP